MKFPNPFRYFFKSSLLPPVETIQVAEEHVHDREQFEMVLQSFKATRIEERLAVLDLFLAIEQHVTLTDLQLRVKESRPELLDRGFLKETMAMFCQFGFAEQRNFENQEPLYEHNHLGDHHDHLICTKCGLIQEFEDISLERLQLSIAKKFQFHPLQHKTEIYGLCSTCMATREPTLPLHLAANGERVRIVRITGGREVKTRLSDMGLFEGACMEIISNNPSGPFVVIVQDTRLALGSGVTQNILVSHSCQHEDIIDE